MAGGGSLSVEKVKRGKAGKRKKSKRVGFVLDMTPLVDITFLLLTFFMFTTTMAAPQVMEMSIPPEIKQEVEVRASELVNIYVREDGKIFYQMGDEVDVADPEPLEMKQIQAFSVKKNFDMKNRLITALKVSSEARYDIVINILDELNLAEAVLIDEMAKLSDPETGEPLKRERRFTIADLSEKEVELLGGLD